MLTRDGAMLITGIDCYQEKTKEGVYPEIAHSHIVSHVSVWTSRVDEVLHLK